MRHGRRHLPLHDEAGVAAAGIKTGGHLPGRSQYGGGIDGAGYGITIAPETNDIWVGNFGFKGATCLRNPASDSVSQFTPEGVPLSPDASIMPGGDQNGGGWTNGGIGWPQGTVTNPDGDIWIANCNGDVTPNGNPDDWFSLMEDDLEKPFDIAFDTQDIAWVTGTNSDNLFAFLANGSQINGSPFDLGSDSKPMGVTSDSRGNVWVANFTTGGLSSFCGANPSACPDSHKTGDALDRHAGATLNSLLIPRARERLGDHGPHRTAFF